LSLFDIDSFVICSNGIMRKTPRAFCASLSQVKEFCSNIFFRLIASSRHATDTQSRSNKLHRHAGRYFGSGDCRASSNVAPADDPPRRGRERRESSL